MRRWIKIAAAGPWLAALALSATAAANEERGEPFCATESMTVREGETRHGDTYFFAQNVTISGTFDGDLIGGHEASVINGVVTGDVVSFGSSLDIGGEVRDSVRFFGRSLNVTGTIDGDLLAFAAQVNVHPEARITGNVHLFAASAFVEGHVGHDLTFKGGHVSVGGPVGGDARLTADRVRLLTGARIEGDLEYTTRKEIEPPEGAIGGKVTFNELVQDGAEKQAKPWFTLAGLVKWIWRTLSSLLVGLVAVAVFRRATPGLVEPIAREGVMVLLVGVGVFLVVPAAAVLAMFLIVPLPLGVIALVLFFIGLYLAKLPVAIWIGRWVLGRLGVVEPSPFVALAVGLVLVYAAFALPYYLGTLCYLVSAWVGLGTLALGLRDRLRMPASPA